MSGMDLYETTLQQIEQHMTPKSCVLWSGGKDSGVLLDLCQAVNPDIAVVYLRVPFLPGKNKFHNEQAGRFSEIHDGIPQSIALRKGENGRVDFYETYSMGGWGLTVARGTERPEECRPYVCGLDWLNRPKGVAEWPWDVMFCGHKSVDIDPLSGPVPLEIGVMVGPNDKKMVFPLRDWEELDIVNYTRDTGLEYDENRYDVNLKTLESKHANSDYFHTCVACLDPDNGEFVECPKYGTCINSQASRAPWVSPVIPYCNVA